MTYIFMFSGFCLVVYGRYIYKKIKRKNNQINVSEKYQKTYEIHQFTGIVQPAEEIEILPYISGFVEKVCVKRGQMVNAGETLLQIGQRPYIVAKETSYAHLQNAKNHLKTMQKYCQQLNEKNEFDEHQIKKAEQAYLFAQKKVNMALEKYEQAFKNYTYTTLKAPVKGILTQVNVQPKNYISPAGKCLFRLLKKSSISVKCQISDTLYRDLSKLSDISKDVWTVQLVISENPPCIYTGAFLFAQSNPDINKSEIVIYFEFPNTDGKFQEGDKLNIQIVRETSQKQSQILTENRNVLFYSCIASFNYKLNFPRFNLKIPHTNKRRIL